jgi:hypothetical protein
MTLRGVYVVARNGSDRPVLQHQLQDGQASFTKCGVDVRPWSRQYTHVRLDAILCRRSSCRG